MGEVSRSLEIEVERARPRRARLGPGFVPHPGLGSARPQTLRSQVSHVQEMARSLDGWAIGWLLVPGPLSTGRRREKAGE